MPDLTMEQIFGNRCQYTQIDEVSDNHTIGVDIRDFQNVDEGGDIKDGLGVSSLSSKYIDFQSGLVPIQTFYAILLLIMQNQAAGKNDDPEQKIYIAESGVSVTSFGNRQGQLERRFTVSIFSDGNYDNSADIDSI